MVKISRLNAFRRSTIPQKQYIITIIIKHLASSVFASSSILSQPICYNKNIKINSKPIYGEEFAKQNIFLYDLFNTEN